MRPAQPAGPRPRNDHHRLPWRCSSRRRRRSQPAGAPRWEGAGVGDGAARRRGVPALAGPERPQVVHAAAHRALAPARPVAPVGLGRPGHRRAMVASAAATSVAARQGRNDGLPRPGGNADRQPRRPLAARRRGPARRRRRGLRGHPPHRAAAAPRRRRRADGGAAPAQRGRPRRRPRGADPGRRARRAGVGRRHAAGQRPRRPAGARGARRVAAGGGRARAERGHRGPGRLGAGRRGRLRLPGLRAAPGRRAAPPDGGPRDPRRARPSPSRAPGGCRRSSPTSPPPGPSGPWPCAASSPSSTRRSCAAPRPRSPRAWPTRRGAR